MDYGIGVKVTKSGKTDIGAARGTENIPCDRKRLVPQDTGKTGQTGKTPYDPYEVGGQPQNWHDGRPLEGSDTQKEGPDWSLAVTNFVHFLQACASMGVRTVNVQEGVCWDPASEIVNAEFAKHSRRRLKRTGVPSSIFAAPLI